MKILIPMMLAVALLGCGQEDTSTAYIDPQTIISSEPIIESGYNDEFQKTVQCLKDNFDIDSRKTPYTLTLLNAPIVTKEGYYVDGHFSFSANTAYILNNEAIRYTIRHETVHWATHLYNDGHESPVFTVCARY